MDGDERLEVPVNGDVNGEKPQSPEQQVRQLEEQLREQGQERERLEKDVEQARLDNVLLQNLASAGTVDMETALLLLQKRVAREDQPEEIRRKVETLRQEKPYLFQSADALDAPAGNLPTAGVKPRDESGRGRLQRLAEKMRTSPSRGLMREYLRLRRNVDRRT